MQFNTQADRIAAIKKACEELGTVYGEMKFKEHMLTEFKQSFVPNTTANEQVTYAHPVSMQTPAPVEAKAETPASKAKAKAAPAPKKAEPETVTEAPAKALATPGEPEAPQATLAKAVTPAVANACPISSATELRDLMLKRFNESGRSTEMQMALKAAVLESTGCEAAMKVPAEMIPAAYDAVMAVEV